MKNLSNNLDGSLKTVKEAADAIKESPNVIRNWMKELKGLIPTIRLENQYHYFDEHSMERLKLIKDFNRNQGFTLKQIQYLLSHQDGKYAEKIQTEDDKSDLTIQVTEIKELLENQKTFNEEVLLRIETQQKLIKSLLVKERDLQLMQSFKISQQEKKQANSMKRGLGKLFSL